MTPELVSDKTDHRAILSSSNTAADQFTKKPKGRLIIYQWNKLKSWSSLLQYKLKHQTLQNF